jgi:hypothetical protein
MAPVAAARAKAISTVFPHIGDNWTSGHKIYILPILPRKEALQVLIRVARVWAHRSPSLRRVSTKAAGLPPSRSSASRPEAGLEPGSLASDAFGEADQALDRDERSSGR